MPCFEEVDKYATPRFDLYENNVITSNSVRWQNSENTYYPDRAGTINQCRSGEDCRVTPGSDCGYGKEEGDRFTRQLVAWP
jgi:hypothetical protein